MTRKTEVAVPVVPPVPVVLDEDWTVAQVASHMGLSYQTARNQMLQGVFGQSKYDAGKRRLSVSADRVKREKTRRSKPTRTRAKRSATRTDTKRPAVPRKGPAGGSPPATPK